MRPVHQGDHLGAQRLSDLNRGRANACRRPHYQHQLVAPWSAAAGQREVHRLVVAQERNKIGIVEIVRRRPEIGANLRPTPDDLDDAEAVALLGNYQTMYFALTRRGALRHGETVLVMGAAGGVGTAAIQVAKALGAKVIALVHRPHGAEFVKSLGADVVLPLTDGWLQAVKDHTGGRGADLVVDPVGGDAFDDAIRALATEGRLLVIGFASGGGIPTVKVNRLLLRNVSVIGVGYGEFVNRTPGSQSLFEFGVAELVWAGLRPPPPVRFPLSKGAEALQSLADGDVLGKVVLEP